MAGRLGWRVATQECVEKGGRPGRLRQVMCEGRVGGGETTVGPEVMGSHLPFRSQEQCFRVERRGHCTAGSGVWSGP